MVGKHVRSDIKLIVHDQRESVFPIFSALVTHTHYYTYSQHLSITFKCYTLVKPWYSTACSQQFVMVYCRWQ